MKQLNVYSYINCEKEICLYIVAEKPEDTQPLVYNIMKCELYEDEIKDFPVNPPVDLVPREEWSTTEIYIEDSKFNQSITTIEKWMQEERTGQPHIIA